jgi:membrane carboxypeptidase/penicillin-binding protein
LPYISLALGCIEANVIQNCLYISSFVNEGEYCMKPIIKRIIDNNGNIIQKTICNKKNNLEKNYIHEIKNTMKLIGDRVQKLLLYLFMAKQELRKMPKHAGL